MIFLELEQLRRATCLFFWELLGELVLSNFARRIEFFQAFFWGIGFKKLHGATDFLGSLGELILSITLRPNSAVMTL